MSQVSIVVPVYNELENVDLMYQELVLAMKNQHRSFEFVVVDDGSRDGTQEALRDIAKVDKRLKLVLLKRNYGQTAAMMAGIQHATGEFIVTIDGDLQNDPADIPMMLDKLEDGFDLVHGWRKNRQDKTLSRKLPSKIANWLISKVTRFPIHDLGCTLKAMRSDVGHQLELYGEMHRFIPILANHLGARCTEVVTGHRARQFGQSKYGIDRTSRVLLDLVTIKFLTDYQSSPMKILGKIGLSLATIGTVGLFASIVLWFFAIAGSLLATLFTLSAISMAVSIQMFALGLIGEVCTRIYYTAHDKKNYQVRDFVNFDTENEAVAKKTTQFPRLAA